MIGVSIENYNDLLLLSLFCYLFCYRWDIYFQLQNSAMQKRQQFEEDIATLESENTNLIMQHATTEAELNQRLQEQNTIPTIPPLTPQVTVTEIAKSNTAVAHQIATDVLIQLNKQYDRAMLLAVEAFRLADTPTTRSTLLYALQHNINLKAVLPDENWGWTESVAFSPDGRFLAVGHTAGQVTLYDLSSESWAGKPLVGLIEGGGENGLTNVTFSPDSQYIAAADPAFDGEGHQIVIWKTDTYEIISTGEEIAREIAFLPDGKHLISRGFESIASWKITPNQELQEVSRLPIPFDMPWYGFPMTVHPTQNWVALSYQEGQVDLWNPFNGEIENSFTPALTTTIANLSYNPSGSLLAINTSGTLILWDTIQEQVIGEPIAAASTATKFSADGRSLLIVNYDESFEVLDVSTLESQSEPLQRWGNSRLLMDIDLHPNGNFIVSGYQTGEVILWDTRSIPRIVKMLPTNNVADSFIDEDTLATVSTDGAIEFWDISSGKLLTQTSGFADPYLRHFVFNENYTIAATHIYTNGVSTISLLDPFSNQPISRSITQTIGVNSLDLNSQGTILATGDEDGVLKLWDTSTGSLINEPIPGHTRRILIVKFSPDDRIIATGGHFEIFVRDVATLQSNIEPIPFEANDLVFHPTLPILVNIKQGGFPIYMWDYTNGNFLGEIMSDDELSQISFDPNGQFAASSHMEYINYGSRSFYTALRDGESLHQIGPNLGIYWNPVFSSEGNFLASSYRLSHENNKTTVWNLDIEFWIDQICRTVNRNLTEKEWNLYFAGQPYRETCSMSQ